MNRHMKEVNLLPGWRDIWPTYRSCEAVADYVEEVQSISLRDVLMICRNDLSEKRKL